MKRFQSFYSYVLLVPFLVYLLGSAGPVYAAATILPKDVWIGPSPLTTQGQGTLEDPYHVNAAGWLLDDHLQFITNLSDSGETHENSVIHILPGTYTISGHDGTSHWKLRKNQKLVGSGKNVTILNFDFVSAVPAIIEGAGDYIEISDFSLKLNAATETPTSGILITGQYAAIRNIDATSAKAASSSPVIIKIGGAASQNSVGNVVEGCTVSNVDPPPASSNLYAIAIASSGATTFITAIVRNNVIFMPANPGEYPIAYSGARNCLFTQNYASGAAWSVVHTGHQSINNTFSYNTLIGALYGNVYFDSTSSSSADVNHNSIINNTLQVTDTFVSEYMIRLVGVTSGTRKAQNLMVNGNNFDVANPLTTPYPNWIYVQGCDGVKAFNNRVVSINLVPTLTYCTGATVANNFSFTGTAENYP